MSKTSAPIEPQARWANNIAYAAALGMSVCFAATAIHFAKWLIPAWDSRGVMVACTIAAIEAIISYWALKHLPTAERQMAFYRVTEWAVIMVAMKLFTELRTGPQSLLDNIMLWPVNYPVHLFSPMYLLNTLLVYVTWQISTLFSSDLYLLEINEAGRIDERIKTTPIRTLIARRYLYFGMAVVILAGATSVQNISGANNTIYIGTVPAVLLYFVLGLVLLSLTRYINLQTIWKQDGIKAPVQVTKRWLLYSALMVGFLVLVSAWLPSNYGFGLIDTFRIFSNAVFSTILFILQFFIFVVVYAFSFLVRNLADVSVGASQSPAIPTQPTPPVNTLNLEFIKSLLIWGFLIWLVIVVLRQYISFNKDIAQDLKRFKLLRWLSQVWMRLEAFTKKTNKAIGNLVQDGLKRIRALGVNSSKLIDGDYANFRRLNTRQKIIFYYLALVKRGEEAGIPRAGGQTPYEYAHSLTSMLEQGQASVEDITESFVESRYSRHNIPAEKANRTQSAWESVRRILRGVRVKRGKKNT